ncbi:hypothetical protein HK098_001978 [Nowakowskiella sp. JEL0407]|nr:hypothetical protein HK098_001978 [Nowakowskiella sp. JEL0407]
METSNFTSTSNYLDSDTSSPIDISALLLDVSTCTISMFISMAGLFLSSRFAKIRSDSDTSTDGVHGEILKSTVNTALTAIDEENNQPITNKEELKNSKTQSRNVLRALGVLWKRDPNFKWSSLNWIMYLAWVLFFVTDIYLLFYVVVPELSTSLPSKISSILAHFVFAFYILISTSSFPLISLPFAIRIITSTLIVISTLTSFTSLTIVHIKKQSFLYSITNGLDANTQTSISLPPNLLFLEILVPLNLFILLMLIIHTSTSYLLISTRLKRIFITWKVTVNRSGSMRRWLRLDRRSNTINSESPSSRSSFSSMFTNQIGNNFIGLARNSSLYNGDIWMKRSNSTRPETTINFVDEIELEPKEPTHHTTLSLNRDTLKTATNETAGESAETKPNADSGEFLEVETRRNSISSTIYAASIAPSVPLSYPSPIFDKSKSEGSHVSPAKIPIATPVVSTKTPISSNHIQHTSVQNHTNYYSRITEKTIISKLSAIAIFTTFIMLSGIVLLLASLFLVPDGAPGTHSSFETVGIRALFLLVFLSVEMMGRVLWWSWAKLGKILDLTELENGRNNSSAELEVPVEKF